MANGIVQRLLKFLIGLDEAVNGLDGGASDETISGTVGRAAAQGKWVAVWILQPLINAIMLNPHHCQDIAAAELKRREETGAP